MQKRKIVAIATVVSVILIDQIIKVAVKTNYMLHDYTEVAPWFRITFTENEGMAFGMSVVGTWALTLFRLVAIGFFCVYTARCIKRLRPMGLIVCLALIIAGAAGNVIDNCLYGLIFTESTPYEVAQLVPIGEGYGSFLSGRVVDMFYFPFFRFPESIPLVGGRMFFSAVFNFADAAISCGAVALLLFYYRTLSNSPSDEKHTEKVAG